MCIRDSPQPVQRSTIDRILDSLNSGEDAQQVLMTTVPPRTRPTQQMSGRSLVEKLIGELAASRESRNPKLVYDRQVEQWTHPEFFTPAYIQHAKEYRSAEVCTVVDVFGAAPEIERLEEMGGCDILYLPELNVDDPYYNPLFMTQQEKDRYNEKGSLAILWEVYICLLYTSPSPRD